MTEQFEHQQDGEIDLTEFFALLWSYKILIGLVTGFSIFLSSYYTVTVDKEYTSSAVFEIKENAEVQERFYGMAKKASDLEVKFKQRETKRNFPIDVIFPRQFLDDIVSNLNSKKKIMVRNVYEGTIPDKYFKISVFFTDEIKTVKNNILPKNISNEFRKIKMAYYQDNEQTPIFEQTILLNDQGIANSFQYDYPDYSLLLKLKKIKLISSKCK